MRPLAAVRLLVALALLAPGAQARYFGFLSWDLSAALADGADPMAARLFHQLRIQGPCDGGL
jgi:hypothetical protein